MVALCTGVRAHYAGKTRVAWRYTIIHTKGESNSSSDGNLVGFSSVSCVCAINGNEFTLIARARVDRVTNNHKLLRRLGGRAERTRARLCVCSHFDIAFSCCICVEHLWVGLLRTNVAWVADATDRATLQRIFPPRSRAQFNYL